MCRAGGTTEGPHSTCWRFLLFCDFSSLTLPTESFLCIHKTLVWWILFCPSFTYLTSYRFVNYLEDLFTDEEGIGYGLTKQYCLQFNSRSTKTENGIIWRNHLGPPFDPLESVHSSRDTQSQKSKYFTTSPLNNTFQWESLSWDTVIEALHIYVPLLIL